MPQSAESLYNWNTLAKNITKTNFCYFVNISYVVMVALCLIAYIRKYVTDVLTNNLSKYYIR